MNAQPHANPNLSPETVPASHWLPTANATFSNNPLIRRMTLENMKTTLDRLLDKCAARAEKVEAITLLAENLAACGHLVSANGATFQITLQQLEAETAMRDRLQMAINGVERAIEWRKSNPLD